MMYLLGVLLHCDRVVHYCSIDCVCIGSDSFIQSVISRADQTKESTIIEGHEQSTPQQLQPYTSGVYSNLWYPL